MECVEDQVPSGPVDSGFLLFLVAVAAHLSSDEVWIVRVIGDFWLQSAAAECLLYGAKGCRIAWKTKTKGRRLERLIDTASFGHIRRYRGAGGIDRAASIVQTAEKT